MESMNITINFKVKDLGFFQLGCFFTEKHLKNKLLHIDKKYDNIGTFLSKKHIAI